MRAHQAALGSFAPCLAGIALLAPQFSTRMARHHDAPASVTLLVTAVALGLLLVAAPGVECANPAHAFWANRHREAAGVARMQRHQRYKHQAQTRAHKPAPSAPAPAAPAAPAPADSAAPTGAAAGAPEAATTAVPTQPTTPPAPTPTPTPASIRNPTEKESATTAAAAGGEAASPEEAAQDAVPADATDPAPQSGEEAVGGESNPEVEPSPPVEGTESGLLADSVPPVAAATDGEASGEKEVASEPDTATEVQPVAESGDNGEQTEAVPEAVPEAEPDAEPDAEPEVRAAVPESESEVTSEPVVTPETEATPEPEAAPEPKPTPEPEPETTSETEAATPEPDATAEPEAIPEPEAAPEPEATPEPVPEPAAGEPEPVAEASPAVETEPVTETGAVTATEPATDAVAEPSSESGGESGVAESEPEQPGPESVPGVETANEPEEVPQAVTPLNVDTASVHEPVDVVGAGDAQVVEAVTLGTSSEPDADTEPRVGSGPQPVDAVSSDDPPSEVGAPVEAVLEAGAPPQQQGQADEPVDPLTPDTPPGAGERRRQEETTPQPEAMPATEPDAVPESASESEPEPGVAQLPASPTPTGAVGSDTVSGNSAPPQVDVAVDRHELPSALQQAVPTHLQGGGVEEKAGGGEGEVVVDASGAVAFTRDANTPMAAVDPTSAPVPVDIDEMAAIPAPLEPSNEGDHAEAGVSPPSGSCQPPEGVVGVGGGSMGTAEVRYPWVVAVLDAGVHAWSKVVAFNAEAVRVARSALAQPSLEPKALARPALVFVADLVAVVTVWIVLRRLCGCGRPSAVRDAKLTRTQHTLALKHLLKTYADVGEGTLAGPVVLGRRAVSKSTLVTHVQVMRL